MKEHIGVSSSFFTDTASILFEDLSLTLPVTQSHGLISCLATVTVFETFCYWRWQNDTVGSTSAPAYPSDFQLYLETALTFSCAQISFWQDVCESLSNIVWWILPWYILNHFCNLFNEIDLPQFSTSTLINFGHRILLKRNQWSLSFQICCQTHVCNTDILLSLYVIHQFMSPVCLQMLRISVFFYFFLLSLAKNRYFQRIIFWIFILCITIFVSKFINASFYFS